MGSRFESEKHRVSAVLWDSQGLQTAGFLRSEPRPCGMRINFEKSHSGKVKASRHPRLMVRTGGHLSSYVRFMRIDFFWKKACTGGRRLMRKEI